MTAPLILAFCAPGTKGAPDRRRVQVATDAIGARWALWCGESTTQLADELGDSPSILLGVGAAGCAALARRVEQDGLEGVVAVVLVDPGAPWAERERCGGCAPDGTCDGAGSILPLGPLEPLRAVADRARIAWTCGDWLGDNGKPEAPKKRECTKPATRWSIVYENATVAVYDTNHEDLAPWMGWESGENVQPLDEVRLVIACHPEPAACAACNGDGSRGTISWGAYGQATNRRCDACSGTGRALGPAEVAAAICQANILPEHECARTDYVYNGLVSLFYPEKARHDREAFGAALRRVLG